MEADHFCMHWRGVKDDESMMTNSVMRGAFLKDANLRREFLSLLDQEETLRSAMLVRLLYASRAAEPIDADDAAARSCKRPKAHNPAHGITGVLCFCASGIFLQVLEGGRDAVNALYNRIARDAAPPRRRRCWPTRRSPSARFAGWAMGQVNMTG